MQLQTFKAPTMAECLSQVKTSMGNDALILHTRTYQTKHWLGLRKREVVEITADSFSVVCADGRIKVSRVKPADGGKVSASDFVKSVNLAQGTRLG